MAYMLYRRENTIKVAYGRYGWVRNSGRTFHGGIDVSTAGDTTIHAVWGGRVKWARYVKKGASGWGNTWEWGYFVWIVGDDGRDYVYAHCKAGSLLVKEGHRVHAGQAIATMGNTGNANLDSQGAHCHFEVRKNGKAIDPSPFCGIPNSVGTTLNGSAATNPNNKIATLEIGPMSLGDRGVIRALCKKLSVNMSEVKKNGLYIITAGPMSGGDITTVTDTAKALKLKVTEKTLFTLIIGPMSDGDKKKMTSLSKKLSLTVKSRKTTKGTVLTIGPMSAGDANTVSAEAKRLKLTIKTT